MPPPRRCCCWRSPPWRCPWWVGRWGLRPRSCALPARPHQPRDGEDTPASESGDEPDPGGPLPPSVPRCRPYVRVCPCLPICPVRVSALGLRLHRPRACPACPACPVCPCLPPPALTELSAPAAAAATSSGQASSS